MSENKITKSISIETSLQYLASDEAIQSLRTNIYWPKWNSPWWHMILLSEMGCAKNIPERVVQEMVIQFKASPLTIFPIHPNELPEGVDRSLDTQCHCSLGNIYQVLAAWGVDVDKELPWIRQWFLRYQLPDGGLNCDNEAYLKTPPPSSMVGTISPLEAVLLYTPRKFTEQEIRFLDLGAQCLLDRELVHATSNPHNAEEIEDEVDWLKVCFPRFYFYDVLRGLNFVLKWSEKQKRIIKYNNIAKAFSHLEQSFPNNQVHIRRHSFEGCRTLFKSPSGEWLRQPTTYFPLLDEVSKVGDISPHLTNQWNEVKVLVGSLSKSGLII